jgi:hypothetical protein
MKQTAVEWLAEQMLHPEFHNPYIKQALEMEKEQVRTILLAYQEDRNDRSDGAENYWEPYEVDDFLEKYNETFNTNY